jgi:hypothetical protein
MPENHGGKRLPVTAGLATLLIAAVATATAYAVIHRDSSQPPRPSGIPATIPDSQVNLMGLSPVPARPAPGFTLTDQDGRVLPLSAFRGKVVVLEFMDPHCTDICPIVSAEFTGAYHDLGKLAGKVVFAAVNVNQYHTAVADAAAVPRPGTKPGRRHHPLLRHLLHRPPRPGTLSRLPGGRPHRLRGVIPAVRADRRLGTGDRADREPPRRRDRLTSGVLREGAGEQCLGPVAEWEAADVMCGHPQPASTPCDAPGAR